MIFNLYYKASSFSGLLYELYNAKGYTNTDKTQLIANASKKKNTPNENPIIANNILQKIKNFSPSKDKENILANT